jgi:DNA-binding GntR family transcriptional regulator
MPSALSRPRILAHEIAEQVRGLIEAGGYAPGVAIRQEEIASRLGVSRIPVREAFRLLEAEGIVTLHANRGAFVTQPTEAEIDELFDVRLMLETDLLTRACAQITDAQLAEIDALDARLAAATDAADWVQRDEEFHAATYAAAGRARTVALVGTLRRSLNAYYRRYLGPSVRSSAWRTEHRALRRALKERDAAAAAEALRRHLEGTRSVLLGALRKPGK